jgi:hypothetical protein
VIEKKFSQGASLSVCLDSGASPTLHRLATSARWLGRSEVNILFIRMLVGSNP